MHFCCTSFGIITHTKNVKLDRNHTFFDGRVSDETAASLIVSKHGNKSVQANNEENISQRNKDMIDKKLFNHLKAIGDIKTVISGAENLETAIRECVHIIRQ